MNVADITQELSDHGFANTVSPTRQVWYINDTIWDICSREKWPFLEKTLTLTFDGTNAFPSNWPSDFKATLDMVNPGTGMVIMPELVDYTDKRNAMNLTQGGDPLYYYFVGSGGTSTGDSESPIGDSAVCSFWPIPSSGTSLQMRYVCQHPQVSANTTESGILLPPQHHRVISLGALWKCFDQEDDPEMATRYQQLYEARIQSMKQDIFMRQYDRPQRIYVIGYDDHDADYYYY